MGLVLHVLAAAGLAIGWAAQPAGDAAPAGGVNPDGGAARARVEPFRTAEDLLRELEEADRDLRTLSADITYDKEMVLEHDRQTRLGTLYFESVPGSDGAPARRKFGIDFRTLILGEAVRDDRKVIVFDGEWLVEKMPAERQFIKRQVVPPGETFDPLRLGEGPFPIPIGQKREDILARYTAELLPAAGGLDRSKPKEASIMKFTVGMDQLRLVPRPERADEDDFEEIRLWYKRSEDGRLLPQLARTISDSGDESLVILRDVRVNEPLPEGAMDTAQPPAGWDVRIVPWERAAGG